MYMCMCISITHSDATCMSSLMAVRTEGNMSQQYENGALFDTRTGALGWLIHQASARARVKSWRNVRHTDTLCLCVCVLIACCKTIRNYFCFSPVPSAVLICLLWTIQGTFLALNGAATLNQPTAQLVTEQWTWRRWTAQRINVRTLTVYSV